MAFAHAFRTLIVTAALAVTVAGAAWAQGKVEVEGGDTYDWGRVSPGQLKATISVKNTGDQPLKISEVRPSCGCTAAPIDKSVLAPGETGKISVTMNATGFGAVKKSLTINSDDPVTPAKVIFLMADIRPVMTFEPANYFLIREGEGKVGVPTATSVTIVNRSEEPFTVEAPVLAAGDMKVVFEQTKPVTLKAGEKLELKAEITPVKPGPVNGEVRVRTSTKENPEIIFNIWGNVAETTVSTTTPSPAAK
jgi:hypothetical protein